MWLQNPNDEFLVMEFLNQIRKKPHSIFFFI